MAKIIDQERQETVEETTQEPVQEELTLDQAVVSEEPQQPQPDEVEELEDTEEEVNDDFENIYKGQVSKSGIADS